jgi:hypothetical protein
MQQYMPAGTMPQTEKNLPTRPIFNDKKQKNSYFSVWL